jgi:hypothetical protein
MLKVYVFASWQINQEYIAQTSCENRNNPNSDCAGSCQLVKQLEATEGEEKPFTPPTGIEKIELSTFTTPSSTGKVQEDSNDKLTYFNTSDKLVKADFTNSFFHPPELLV